MTSNQATTHARLVNLQSQYAHLSAQLVQTHAQPAIVMVQKRMSNNLRAQQALKA